MNKKSNLAILLSSFIVLVLVPFMVALLVYWIEELTSVPLYYHMTNTESMYYNVVNGNYIPCYSVLTFILTLNIYNFISELNFKKVKLL